ncbi:putative calmodulin-dependent protein kinase type 1 [Chytridium lagenaria]|nr:putative calmodulin-dependent protein kinase type 1 [Chytridium lagenaria]
MTGRTLGQGSYATVKEAIQIRSGERFAVKVISKKLMQGREHMILNEIEILKKVSKGHKNIVTLHDSHLSSSCILISAQVCTGGELFDRICEKGSFYEEDAAEIVRTVVDAVGYLHEQNIVTPENLLFRSKETLSELVIADFGLSKIMDPETYEGLMTTCGTPGYMAPEVIRKTGHGRAVDLWSIGVLSYFLLCGYTPFDSTSSADELQRILTGSYSFEPTEYWQEVSDTAKDFIRSLLIVEAGGRLTAKQALRHPWLAQLDPVPTADGAQPTRVRTVDLLPNVKARFDAKRMFKKAIGVVKAINKLAQSPNVSQENLASAAMSVDDAALYRPREDEVAADGHLMVISRP